MNSDVSKHEFLITKNNDYQIRLSPIEDQLPEFVMKYFKNIKSNLEHFNKTSVKKLILLCDILIDYSWEMMNSNIWLFIEDKWRFIYGYATLYKLFLMKNKQEDTDSYQNQKEIIKLCDMGLLMSKPFLDAEFNQIIKSFATDISNQSRESSTHIQNDIQVTLNDQFKIIKEVSPSIENFSTNYKEKMIPVIIQKAMDHWPAMQGPNKWRF